MEERAAREDETGAGAVTVVDVTGDAQSLAPGKLLNWLLNYAKVQKAQRSTIRSDYLHSLIYSFQILLLQFTNMILCIASFTLRKMNYASHE